MPALPKATPKPNRHPRCGTYQALPPHPYSLKHGQEGVPDGGILLVPLLVPPEGDVERLREMNRRVACGVVMHSERATSASLSPSTQATSRSPTVANAHITSSRKAT